jgi:hypothetical protein
MTHPMKCPLCGGVHDRCEFGLGLDCLNGDRCLCPHHRADRAGLCSRCAGVVFIGDRVVTVAGRTEHERCARKAGNGGRS